MNWRLGLDLGTNSIGWSVLALDDNLNPTTLENLGVRIFSDGRDPKTREPLAVARRTARGIRRNLYRRKQRRRNLFKLLQEQNLFPKNRAEAQRYKLLDPYALRVKALDEILSPHELGRVLFHLSVRRGFKSNRKDNTESSEKTDEKKLETLDPSKMSQADKCQFLTESLSASSARTLGEFLNDLKEKGSGIRFTAERATFYPLRSMYEDEFEAIKAKQIKRYSTLAWDAIHTAIFCQRPLRPQERGKCQFMVEKDRTFKALPCSQQFRILQEVYNLTMYDSLNAKVPLSDVQRDLIINKLNQKDNLTFDAIRKELKTTNRFNLESENRTELKGNDTARKMRSERNFGPLWDTLTLVDQDAIVEMLILADEDSVVLDMLSPYSLSDDQKKSITRLVFSTGTTSVCKEFTEQIVAKMIETGLQYYLAIKLVGYEHSEQDVRKSDTLPYYGKVLTGSTMGGDLVKHSEDKPEKKYGKIGNPTVHVALNQTRTVLNALIKQYGKPKQVVIELSRDLKATREQKTRILKKQAENTKRNIILNKNITDVIPTISYPGRFERQKFMLWEELGADSFSRCCLYCGKNISATELFSPNIEIEHILPFSRTLLDNQSNLTISHKKCNAEKREHSPFEAFGSNPPGYNWEEIMRRVASLKNPVKKGRFSQDAMEQFEKDSSFITRQLTDNAYLSKISLRYVKAICDDVWSVNGGMTKLLRDKWDIDSILKRKIGDTEIMHFGLKDDQIGLYKKNRYDHRHHALDAVVIGLVDRSLVQEVATLNARSQKNRLEAPQLPLSYEDLTEKVKNIVVSFKPDHGPEGKLSKETLLGCIKVEQNVSIENLSEQDILNIKVDRVRNEIEALFAEKKDLKKTLKELKEVFPLVKVFRPQFVNRKQIIDLKTEKNIEEIIDPCIRQKIQTYIASRPDQKIENVLMDFIKETGIKKARCKTVVQKPIVIQPDARNPLSVTRFLNPEDYYAAIIWQIPPETQGKSCKYEAQYIRRTELNKQGAPIELKPHPAAKKICQLHKDDYIEFSENGIWKKARIAGYSATANKLDIRPLCSTNSVSDWIVATNEKMLEKGWKKVDGHYFVSVNVLFEKGSARKLTVSPLGRVFRKA